MKYNFNKGVNFQEVSMRSLNPEKKEKFNRIYRNAYMNFIENEKYLRDLQDFYFNNLKLKGLNNFIFLNTEFIIKRFTDLLGRSDDSEFSKLKKLLPTGTCLPFSVKLFLNARGKVLPCERIDFKEYFFQIDDSPVEINFDEIVKRYNNYFNKIKKLCSICSKSLRCTKCIFQMKLNEEIITCDEFVSANEHSKVLSIYFDIMEEKPSLYNKAFKGVVFA